MAFIRSVDLIAKKWAEVTPRRADSYAEGIANPRRSWKAGAMAAESSYEEGVRDAISRKAFGKGVAKAGDAKWSRKATVNGIRNWGPGVAEARGDYEAGFAPYRDAIAAVKLSPRYARRDPRNIKRVEDVVKALVAKKLSLMGK